MVERYREPQRIGIIPHGYWIGDVAKDNQVVGSKLALRSHMVSRAAAVEARNQEAIAFRSQTDKPEIILPLGRLRGPEKPSEGSLMKQTITNYGINPDLVMTTNNAYSTGREVETALATANIHQWTKIVDIAFKEHLKSIKMLFNRFGPQMNVEYKSVEDILSKQDVHRFKRRYIRRTTDENGQIHEESFHLNHEHNHSTQLVRKLKRSRYEFAYKWFYELPKRTLLKLGLNPQKLEDKNRKARETSDPKHVFAPFGIPIPIDIYNIDGKRSEAPFVHSIVKIADKIKGFRKKSEKVKKQHPNVEIIPSSSIYRF